MIGSASTFWRYFSGCIFEAYHIILGSILRFFKAKMQRETMLLLIVENGRQVTGEGPRLTEVARNYTEQFAEPPLTLSGSRQQRELVSGRNTDPLGIE
jgi:hypothetical protein